MVDEAAMIAALRGRQLGFAAVDVVEAEPLPPGHPLLSLENLIVTPHVAGCGSCS